MGFFEGESVHHFQVNTVVHNDLTSIEGAPCLICKFVFDFLGVHVSRKVNLGFTKKQNMSS